MTVEQLAARCGRTVEDVMEACWQSNVLVWGGSTPLGDREAAQVAARLGVGVPPTPPQPAPPPAGWAAPPAPGWGPPPPVGWAPAPVVRSGGAGRGPVVAIAAVVGVVAMLAAAVTLLGTPSDENDANGFVRAPIVDDDDDDGATKATDATDPASGAAGTTPSTTIDPAMAVTSSAEDIAIVSAAVVTEAVLPPGWVQCCPDVVYGASGLTEHICGSAADLPPHSAGMHRHFSLNPTLSGLEQGHIQQTVLLAPTEADAAREFEAIDAAGYAACAEASVARTAQDSVPDATELIDVSFERSALPDGAPGIVDRFSTYFGTSDGGLEDVYVAFVRMQRGRAIVRMPITTYATPLSDAELQPLVAAATQTLQEALD
jgi:hypothetical protein